MEKSDLIKKEMEEFIVISNELNLIVASLNPYGQEGCLAIVLSDHSSRISNSVNLILKALG